VTAKLAPQVLVNAWEMDHALLGRKEPAQFLHCPSGRQISEIGNCVHLLAVSAVSSRWRVNAAGQRRPHPWQSLLGSGLSNSLLAVNQRQWENQSVGAPKLFKTGQATSKSALACTPHMAVSAQSKERQRCGRWSCGTVCTDRSH